MSSIITNNSSIIALQTLKKLNMGMQTVQDQVSTGLKVGSAKDSASIWAIATTMKSDVSGYKAIGDSLGTAIAAIGVGRDAGEQITDLLKQMRTKIADASAVGADTATIQTDVDNLRSTISSIVAAASFNGVNLVDGSIGTAGVDVLSSIDRTNGVTSTDDKYINVAGYDLTSGTAGAGTGTFTGSALLVTEGGAAAAGAQGAVTIPAGDTTETVTIAATNSEAGDRFSIKVGDKTATYTLTADDITNSAASPIADLVAGKLKSLVADMGVTGFSLDYDPNTAPGAVVLNNTGTGNTAQTISFSFTANGNGSLSALQGVDVTSAANRTSGLATVDAALATVIAATAALGSSQARLTTQQDFMSKLADNVNIGVGSLVDANMEEASARLTALQTQQQLAIQSLSIANQAPQNLLALFK